MLLIDKSFSGTGKKIINDFLQSFQNEFEKFVINYADHSTVDCDLEHIFWFGEQQVKTAATCALNKPCNGHLMQEPVNLFGAALTILPIFTRYKSDDEEVLLIDNNTLEQLGRKIIGQANSNVCGGFVIPKKLQSITSFYDENAEKEKYQSFPGVIMLWTVYKFTRT